MLLSRCLSERVVLPSWVFSVALMTSPRSPGVPSGEGALEACRLLRLACLVPPPARLKAPWDTCCLVEDF